MALVGPLLPFVYTRVILTPDLIFSFSTLKIQSDILESITNSISGRLYFIRVRKKIKREIAIFTKNNEDKNH